MNCQCRLSNSQGNLLDDTQLIDVLAVTKQTAQDVSDKLANASETNNKINEACEEYRPVAHRATLIYFLIAEFSVVNCMYQTSLAQFNELYEKSIDASEKASMPSKRIANIIEHMTYEIYLYIQVRPVANPITDMKCPYIIAQDTSAVCLRAHVPLRRSFSDACMDPCVHIPHAWCRYVAVPAAWFVRAAQAAFRPDVDQQDPGQLWQGQGSGCGCPAERWRCLGHCFGECMLPPALAFCSESTHPVGTVEFCAGTRR